MNDLVLSDAAITNLTAIAEYGERCFGSVQSNAYKEILRAKFAQTTDSPPIFTRVDELREGYRRAVVGSHSIYFRIENSQIQVIRILRNQALPSSLDVED